MKPEDLNAMLKATQTIVSKLPLVAKKQCVEEILLLKRLLKDDKNVIDEPKPDRRGKHWAELRLLQNYQLVDEYGAEKEVSHADVLAMTGYTDHKLKVALHKGGGSITVQIVDRKSYKRTDATITKL